MSKILSGTDLANHILSEVRSQVDKLTTQPQLGIILVGHNAASELYVRRKQRAAKKLGIRVQVHRLAESCLTEDLIRCIVNWNDDPTISAILVQMPLPSSVDRLKVLSAIKPTKDVDGLSPTNLGLLLSSQPQLVPATARGIIRLLDHYQITLPGKKAMVIGRSILVGQPTAVLLSQAGATVTIAHRQTNNLPQLLHETDIIISAAGQPDLVKAEHVPSRAVIIDVGITRLDEGLSGDANLVFQTGEVAAISPVPGGVGPLTVACLMENILICHQLIHQ